MSRSDWQRRYNEEIAQLVPEARAHGTLRIYSGLESVPLINAVRKCFWDNYNIEVTWLRAAAGELLAKVRAEVSVGRILGDCYFSGSPTSREAAAEGCYGHYIPPAALEPGVTWVIEPLLDQKEEVLKGKAFPITIFPSPHGCAVNSDLVAPEKMPHTFRDLLDPFWKDKIAMHDPRVTGGGNVTYLWMKKLYGEEYLKKLKAQGVFLEQDYASGTRAVAAGKYAIYIGGHPRYMIGMEKAHVRLIYPEGMVGTLNMIGILKGCPNPAAAKLYVNFLLSKTGQGMASELGACTPLRGDVRATQEIADMAYMMSIGNKLLPPFSYEEDLRDKAMAREHAERLFGGNTYKS